MDGYLIGLDCRGCCGRVPASSRGCDGRVCLFILTMCAVAFE